MILEGRTKDCAKLKLHSHLGLDVCLIRIILMMELRREEVRRRI
jgi:hypothetical protein